MLFDAFFPLYPASAFSRISMHGKKGGLSRERGRGARNIN
jgi:hypothetical protein